MARDTEILIERIDQRLAEMGKSRWWLSMQVSDGKQGGIVKDIERKGTMPGGARLQHIAEVLETTTDWLLGRSDTAQQVTSMVSFRDAPQPWGGPPVDGIPVRGTAFCDDLAVEGEDGGAYQVERVLLEWDHTVQLLRRPPALYGAADAYAIYLHGESMEPRFYPGDLAVVDPRRPPRPGDDIVLQLADGNGGQDVVTVLVKQLVRITAAYVELRQHNPAQTFRVPRGQVLRMHRIMTSNELLAG